MSTKNYPTHKVCRDRVFLFAFYRVEPPSFRVLRWPPNVHASTWSDVACGFKFRCLKQEIGAIV